MHRHMDQAGLAPACTHDGAAHPYGLKTPARLWRWWRRRPTPPEAISAFPMQSTQRLRLADIRRYGDISNAVFAVCQLARMEMVLDPAGRSLSEGTHFVIARTQLDFLGEVHWPGTIEIGTRVDRMGRASVVIAQGLFLGVRCVARARAVVMLMDRATRRPTLLPAPLVDALHDMAQRGIDDRASAMVRIRRVITGLTGAA